MKKINFTLRIDEAIWDEFKEYCIENGFLISRKAGILVEEFVKKINK
ncbi:hypothetical protein LCGC14_0476310 [marine sediment metagenome]|uniref:Uncharacterized protein n=1 Tax=marine sediment metagenome TaxID=412755 RepID=A0A0F9VJC6_9ZZZZ